MLKTRRGGYQLKAGSGNMKVALPSHIPLAVDPGP